MTDNEPLKYIFGPKNGIPVMKSNPAQRIALILTGYQFDVENVVSEDNVMDYLSRKPNTITLILKLLKMLHCKRLNNL